MISGIVPAIFAVVGALIYAFATNPKFAELGRLMFACGLLVTLFVAAHTRLALP